MVSGVFCRHDSLLMEGGGGNWLWSRRWRSFIFVSTILHYPLFSYVLILFFISPRAASEGVRAVRSNQESPHGER